MGVSKNSGTQKWMVKIMENRMNKWMILGENPLFSETPIFIYNYDDYPIIYRVLTIQQIWGHIWGL